MIWFTSDLHFGHQAIIEFCNRPFENVEAMDAELIRRWNSGVKPEDTIYVLGDYSFRNPRATAEITSHLNGKKILVQGNHDHHSRTQYESWGFVLVDELVVTLLGRRIRMSHFPYWPAEDEDVERKERRYPYLRPKDDGGILLCGHVHQWWKTCRRMINVGVDVWDYKPISLSTVELLVNRIDRGEKLGADYVPRETSVE